MATSFTMARLDERDGGADSRRRSPARNWAIAAVLLAAGFGTIGTVYWDTIVSTVRVWGESETFNHGFLIFPISGYLIWRRWDSVATLSPCPWPWGLVLLALASLFWVVGRTAGVLVAEQIAVVAMVQALALTVLGLRLFRALLFPLLFLYFAVPVGTALTLSLQHLTAEMVVPALRLTGIPVFLDDLLLTIPSGSFEVAEACSGLRYLISSVAIGVLAANLLLESTWRRIVLLALCIVIPIIANGVRAYGIIMIAHLSSYEYAVGADHLIYGWIFFSFVTLCLLGAAVALRAGEGGAGDSVASVPFTAGYAIGPGRAGALLVLIATSAALGSIYQALVTPDLSATATLEFPPRTSAVAPWTAADGVGGDWQPLLPGSDIEVDRRYQLDRQAVDFFLAYFRYQRQGAELINESNQYFDPKKWRPADPLERTVATSRSTVSVHQVLLRATGKHPDRLLWYWYWVDRRFVANRYLAKLLELKAKLLDGSGAAAFLALSTPVEGSMDEAVARLKSVLELVEEVDLSLENAAEGVAGPSS